MTSAKSPLASSDHSFEAFWREKSNVVEERTSNLFRFGRIGALTILFAMILSSSILAITTWNLGTQSKLRGRTLIDLSARIELNAEEAAAAAAQWVRPEKTGTDEWWKQVPEHVNATTTAMPELTTSPEPDWFNMLTGGEGAGTPLAPRATMNDGNFCADDEEQSERLCYKKCSTLTFGDYPIRTSAWTCCKSRPCTMSNQKHNVGICSGFDVSGDLVGQGACPHAAGTCLNNEEIHLGTCYKKCSIMEPDFPERFGPQTCCKGNGIVCAMPGNSVTSPTYSVGGGAGDGDPATPSKPHRPFTSLTEGG